MSRLELPGLPRRMPLSLAELVGAARLAGDVPLPLRLGDASPDGLDDRLGGSAPAAALDDVRRELGRDAIGGELEPEAAMALQVLATGALLVQLDLAAGRGGRVIPLRSWFAVGGRVVAQLSTSGGRDYELGWFDVALWTSQLLRAITLPDVGGGETVVPARVSLPSELLVAGCAAVRDHRSDVLAVLAADHGRPDLVPVITALETGCRGRLRVLARRRDLEHKPAVATWLLLDDGWRELRPGPGATSQLRRREPRDLARWLATSVSAATEVTR